ncbi:glycoside hydrolase family 3 N-terminal domain-containing protein [Salsuginibacillus kocurii]|uniref:glycoside hydrolase family 3 N-terminal domain-containing protein n=1 Tax=Salsuginibacillus kocurii TaxID=427078 RepID=UPI000372B248|nr:glycoside hydrolase family 3 N-terminal domain-containing protein [Salsuginibacillus kocurii]
MKNSRTTIMTMMAGLLVAGLVAPQPNQAEGEELTADHLLLYENIPEIEPHEGTEKEFELTPLRLTGEAGFEEVSLNLSWASSNEEVATINNGTVSVEGAGEATLTVSDGETEDDIHLQVAEDESFGLRSIDDHSYDVLSRALDHLSQEQKIGQIMMPDFRTWDGEDVTKMNEEIEAKIEEYHLGGIILFAENTVETEQTIDLVQDYKEAADQFGMLLTTDQEGGIVTRLQEATDMPGNMAVGATRSNELAFKTGNVIGAELEALGINMNLAPVVDVNNNPDNPVIGVRSFGEDPELVGELGVSYMEGLQEHGTASIAKHFPGHGDTDVDSHIGLPEVPHDRERLFNVELVPFQKIMDEDIDAIMTSHVTFPEIDDTTVISEDDGSEIALPATLSEEVLTGLVREEMEYDGVIMTDALDMDAIADHFDPVDAVIRTINAGTDIVLMPVGLPEVFEGVYEAVQNGEIEQERLDEAVERVLTLKLERGIFKQEETADREELKEQVQEIILSEEHVAIEQEVAEESITLVKNEDETLPLNSEEGEMITVVGAEDSDQLAEAVEAYHTNVQHIELEDEQETLTEEQQAVIAESNAVIVGSNTFEVDDRSPEHPHMMVYQHLAAESEAPVIGVGIRNPYDVMTYDDVDAYLAQYGFQDASFEATAATIFGENEPNGELPVTIYDHDDEELFPYVHGLTYEEQPAPPVEFNDVSPSDRGYEEIMTLVGEEILEGVAAGTFAPEASITREEAAIMLTRASSLPIEEEVKSSYNDVDQSWYGHPYIEAVTAEGIFEGDDKGAFNPKASITRAESAAVLVRAWDLEGHIDEEIEDIQGHSLQGEIETLYAHHITNGTGEQEYSPHLDITRQDFAVMLHDTMY